MIGPGKPGGEGFARRLNKAEWMDQNASAGTLSEAAGRAFLTVIAVGIGAICTASIFQGLGAPSGSAL